MNETDFSVAELAIYLAYLRWRRERRAKHGPHHEPSPRVRTQWFKHKAVPAAEALVVQGANELRGVAESDFERMIRVWMLQRIHDARRVSRGRPRKVMSLMDFARASVATERPPGRPLHIQPSEQAQWVAYMTGLKLRKFAEAPKANAGTNRTAWSTLSTLQRAARSVLGKDDEQATLEYLNCTISDAAALRDTAAQRLGTSASTATIAKRLQRARQRHPFIPAALKARK